MSTEQEKQERIRAAAPQLLAALIPFAEPHFMGDAYVRFSPALIKAAREAVRVAIGDEKV